MTLFPTYASAIETLSVYLALLFSLIFIFAIIIWKTASNEDAYTQSNRIHFYIGILYAAALTGLAIYLNQVNLNYYIGILTGLYIYFSFHYVFIFPLIGICKKSISINILESISHIQKSGVPCSKVTLANNMALRNASIDDIRSSRLNQMIMLKFATSQGNHFQITFVGKRVHELGEIILGIWNQKRL
jgi:hypothetical protein